MSEAAGRSDVGQVGVNCTVITMEPNELVSPIHNRMPAIVHQMTYGKWLGAEAAKPDQLKALLRPFPVERM